MDQHLTPHHEIKTAPAAPVGAPSHYYGDIVRRLFVLAAVILTLFGPFVAKLQPLPPLVVAAIVLLLLLVAGLTNPLQRWSSVVNLLIAAGGLLTFVYYALQTYTTAGTASCSYVYFGVNHVLAIIFGFALYFSSKTFRGIFLGLPDRPEFRRKPFRFF